METKLKLVEAIYEEFAEEFQERILSLARNGAKPLAKKMNLRGYSIFNSDPRITLQKGEVYVIGLNPGGADSESFFEPESVNSWVDKPLGWNAYYDEFWNGNNFSQHQLNIRRVLSQLLNKPQEEATKTSFSTNLYFYKTPGESELLEYPQLLIDCWKYHDKFLSIVQPNLILCVGNGDFSSFAEMYNRFGKNRAMSSFCLNPKRYVRAFKLEDKTIIGIPHLSRPYASIDSILRGLEQVVKGL